MRPIGILFRGKSGSGHPGALQQVGAFSIVICDSNHFLRFEIRNCESQLASHLGKTSCSDLVYKIGTAT